MTPASSSLRIKFFCRSFDLRLYTLSKRFYEDLGYPCVRLTDQSADGYFYTILDDTACDIAINVDEDCFLLDPQAVLRLVDYVVANGYASAGCPDGGEELPRSGNPIVTNPFFNIFDLRQIRTKFSREAVRRFRYTDRKAEMIAAFDASSLGGHYTFDRPAVIEPYYAFFLWLADNFTTLYLTPRRHTDGIATILYDPAGNALCAHAWFARFYAIPSMVVRLFQPNAGKQKARIDALIAFSAEACGKDLPPKERWQDSLRYAFDKCVRYLIKGPQRIAAWPAKYHRYHTPL